MLVGFHLTHRMLVPGDIIEPGNWGSVILATGASHDWYEREQLMEAIRVARYPEKPSRLQTAYFFPHLEHALHYWVNFSQGDRVYCVQVADDLAPQHHAFMTCLPPISDLTDEQVAHHYWRTDLKVTRGLFQTATEEILTTSPLVVTQEFLLHADMFEDPSVISVDLSART